MNAAVADQHEAGTNRGIGQPLVQIRNLSKVYERGKQKLEVLHHIDLDIARGDFFALMGPSGSGKTTLLNMIGGLDSPTDGSISVDGKRIDQMGEGQLARWRASNVGFVFQFYNLMPALSAQKNVELPLLLTKLSGAQRRKNAGIALQLVGLADRARDRSRSAPTGLRRADRRPRSPIRRGSADTAAAAEPRARQDHRDGHARSQGRRIRVAHAASR